MITPERYQIDKQLQDVSLSCLIRLQQKFTWSQFEGCRLQRFNWTGTKNIKLSTGGDRGNGACEGIEACWQKYVVRESFGKSMGNQG
jgi:hypothetical protein